MKALPVWAVRVLWMLRIGRADLCVVDVGEQPNEGELRTDVLYREIRDGYLKWAYLVCPRCREQIQLPLAGKGSWIVTMDLLRRPTVRPSVWQTGSCGAHFFIDRGHFAFTRD